MPPDPRPPATVIVATHDRPALLEASLPALVAACRPGDEIIVVASGPGYATAPGARLIHLDDRRKTAKVNVAAVVADHDLLLLTDDDCVVVPGWVEGMVAAFTDAGVGVAFGPVEGLSAVPGGRPAAVLPPGRAPAENWAYAHGASMAVRRSALIDVGGFDERLGPGASSAGEEADLAVRLAASGWHAAIADAPVVGHLKWRSDDEDAANQLLYERGAGVWVGAGLRRDPRRVAKIAALRLRYQAQLYEDPLGRGLAFGPRTTRAFGRGVVEGLGMPPRRFIPPGAATGRRPRVLWVTDEPPDITAGGGNIRQWHLVDAFCDRADTSILVTGEVLDRSLHERAVEIVAVPPRHIPMPTNRNLRRLVDLWLAFGQRGPDQVFSAGPARRAMVAHLRRMERDVDLVVVNHHGLEPLVAERRAARWIFHLHHAAAHQVEQELQTVAGRRQRLMVQRQLVKSAALERHGIESYDGLVAVSDDDADAMVKLAGGHLEVPIWVSPNGVDVSRYRPTPIPAAPRLMLTASLNYLPNVDGARWFCDEVFPLVRADVPDATLDIVGRNPVPQVAELAERPGVDLHANVPSMVEWLDRTRVSVVPLRIGTGSRIKALEAMAAGRPVLGTSIGLAGLGLVSGEHAVIADDAGALAAGIVDVLRSDELAGRLATAGRDLVERKFRWDHIAAELADSLLATLAVTHSRA